MKPLLTLLLLLFPLFSEAQLTLSGKVQSENGAALPFANVRVLRADSGDLVRGTTADVEGNFQLKLTAAGTYLFRADYLGYEHYETSITFREDLHLGVITLAIAASDLAEVVVRGDRPVIEQHEDKLLFNVATSPLKTGYDAVEVLARSPNVWVSEDEGVQVRNARAMVQVNGRPLNLQGAALRAYLEAISSDNIIRIEVKTSADAAVNANIAGGVVNIVLKQPVRGINGNLRAAYLHRAAASWSDLAGFNLNYGSKHWNIYGGYDYLKNKRDTRVENTTDYFLTGNFLADQQFNRDTFLNNNFRLGAVATLHPDHTVGIEFFRRASDFNFDETGTFDLSNNGEALELGTTDFIGIRNSSSANATFNYTWKTDTAGSVFNLYAEIARDQADAFNQTSSFYTMGFLQDNQDRNTTDNATEIRDVQADYATRLGKFKVSIGGKWTDIARKNLLLAESQTEQIWRSNDRSSSFNYDETVLAGYVTLSRQLNEKTFLKVGLRAEQTQLLKTDLLDGSVIEQRYSNWFPSFFFSRKMTEQTTISLSYSKRLRRPSFNLLNDNVFKLNDFRFNLGNPNLTPEFRHRFELAAKVRKHQFALFFNRVTDAINGIYFLEGDVAFYQKFNSGSQTEYGLEYNRAADVTPWWFLRATGRLFSRQFITEDGATTFQQSTLKLRATNNFKLGKTTRLEVRATWYSAQADAFFIREPLRELDAMLQQQLLGKKLAVRFHVRDLLNTLRFANRRPFDTFSTTNEVWPITRTYNLRLAYTITGNKEVSKRKNRSQNEARRRM